TIAVSAVCNGSWKRYHPEPYHTSILTGAGWVKELCDGHSDRIKENLGLRRHVFFQLVKVLQQEGGLKPRRHVDIDEIVATFLY
ncbi:hypothetical protein K435DRAFT_565986, partial [Dendrothele bispora CBS 962.96]